jgi:hypothetical protein
LNNHENWKNHMKWDEEAYGLEYDLDVYNIVAVNDFNMGAIQHGRHGDCGVHERCTCGCCLCSSVSGSISPRGRSEE